MTDQARLSWALALSLLLHMTLLALLPVLRRLSVPVAASSTVEVDLSQLALPARKPAARPAPPPPQAAPQPAPEAQPPPPVVLPQRQIVSPSDQGEQKPPEETRLLSDRDNTVPQEMIRRGQPAPGKLEAEAKAEKAEKKEAAPPVEKAVVRRQAAPAKPAQAAPQQMASLPKLDQLLPPVGDIITQGFSKPEEPRPQEQVASAPHQRNLFAGSGGAFSARPGISDFLPTIREGDVTLLNTKAELFAPFVRRVATRVFQHLEIRLKQAARGRPGGSGREYAEVEAVMSKKGQLISARVLQKESNTNIAAYRELLSATEPDVFFDANPPPGAEANDGNIHFILLVDLHVQSAVDQRTGAPATGYYGIAGVGLDSAPNEE
jgi:hypothetical protein